MRRNSRNIEADAEHDTVANIIYGNRASIVPGCRFATLGMLSELVVGEQHPDDEIRGPPTTSVERVEGHPSQDDKPSLEELDAGDDHDQEIGSDRALVFQWNCPGRGEIGKPIARRVVVWVHERADMVICYVDQVHELHTPRIFDLVLVHIPISHHIECPDKKEHGDREENQW